MSGSSKQILAPSNHRTPRRHSPFPHLGTKDNPRGFSAVRSTSRCLLKSRVTALECQINCDVYLALLDEQIHETRCLEQKMQVQHMQLQQIWNAARSEKGKKLKQSIRNW
jgi:hypothetical protein